MRQKKKAPRQRQTSRQNRRQKGRSEIPRVKKHFKPWPPPVWLRPEPCVVNWPLPLMCHSVSEDSHQPARLAFRATFSIAISLEEQQPLCSCLLRAGSCAPLPLVRGEMIRRRNISPAKYFPGTFRRGGPYFAPEKENDFAASFAATSPPQSKVAGVCLKRVEEVPAPRERRSRLRLGSDHPYRAKAASPCKITTQNARRTSKWRRRPHPSPASPHLWPHPRLFRKFSPKFRRRGSSFTEKGELNFAARFRHSFAAAASPLQLRRGPATVQGGLQTPLTLAFRSELSMHQGPVEWHRHACCASSSAFRPDMVSWPRMKVSPGIPCPSVMCFLNFVDFAECRRFRRRGFASAGSHWDFAPNGSRGNGPLARAAWVLLSLTYNVSKCNNLAWSIQGGFAATSLLDWVCRARWDEQGLLACCVCLP